MANKPLMTPEEIRHMALHLEDERVQMLAAREVLFDTMDQARELLVEVRQSIKDMKAAKSEVDAALREGVTAQVSALVEETVRGRLDALGRVTKAEMDRCVAKVASEFGKLERAFLGTEKDGKDSLEELLRRSRMVVERHSGARCDALATKGTGVGACDRPVDRWGLCDRASDHL